VNTIAPKLTALWIEKRPAQKEERPQSLDGSDAGVRLRSCLGSGGYRQIPTRYERSTGLSVSVVGMNTAVAGESRLRRIARRLAETSHIRASASDPSPRCAAFSRRLVRRD
jgi:hypothetical protein